MIFYFPSVRLTSLIGTWALKHLLVRGALHTLGHKNDKTLFFNWILRQKHVILRIKIQKHLLRTFLHWSKRLVRIDHLQHPHDTRCHANHCGTRRRRSACHCSGWCWWAEEWLWAILSTAFRTTIFDEMILRWDIFVSDTFQDATMNSFCSTLCNFSHPSL